MHIIPADLNAEIGPCFWEKTVKFEVLQCCLMMLKGAISLCIIILIVIVSSDTIPYACSTNFNHYPFCNASLSTKDRVNDLISRLTLDEKATLLTARESPLNFLPRLGLPEFDWGTPCIHAVRAHCGTSCATTFPEPNGLGATFNRTLISNVSFVMGLELRALWLLGVS